MKNEDQTTIIAAYGNCYNSEVVDVLPNRDIPIEMEDAPLHDGIHACNDATCPCQLYGYGDVQP